MRYVISDVHGCLETLKRLIEHLALSPVDEVFFLGDYIDKGKNSSGVLDFLIQLRQTHNVHCLRGNHEENILETSLEYEPAIFRLYVGKLNKSPDLLTPESKIVPHFEAFMQDLPYYFELSDAWLVHAGFYTLDGNMLMDKKYMLEGRRTQYDAVQLAGKPIIHGHTVTYRQAIEQAVRERANIIPLDNGCVYNKPHKIYDYIQTGFLCCLNLDNYELIWQENIDG